MSRPPYMNQPIAPNQQPPDRWHEAFQEGRDLAHLFPSRPTACWMVSAGHDMRPLVYFSDPFRAQVADQNGMSRRALSRPDLFLFTSLSMPGGTDGLHDLLPGQIAYQDHGTRITVASITPLHIRRERIQYRVDPSRVHFAKDPLNVHSFDAALLRMQVDCLHTGYREQALVLYLAMENLNAFDAYLSQGPFDVRYLVATREGVGMGGCGESVLRYLYAEERILAGRERGFEPQFVVTWDDCTDREFRSGAGRIYPDLRLAAPYIKERGLPFAHQMYRLWA